MRRQREKSWNNETTQSFQPDQGEERCVFQRKRTHAKLIMRRHHQGYPIKICTCW